MIRCQKLLDQLRAAVRYKHYALSTEKAYVYWARAFIRFHGVQSPLDALALQTTASPQVRRSELASMQMLPL